jgi:hypothetical protein
LLVAVAGDVAMVVLLCSFLGAAVANVNTKERITKINCENNRKNVMAITGEL